MMVRERLHFDDNLTISRYSGRPGEVFSVKMDVPVSNVTIDKYLVYTKGDAFLKDDDGNVIVHRTAGDTTDTGEMDLVPGIYYLEAGDMDFDFYSVTKNDYTRVNRIEHRMNANDELDITTPCVLFIATGYVDVRGVGTIPAPYTLDVVTSMHVTAIDNSLIVELT